MSIKTTDEGRIVYLDYLRVYGTIAIMVLHTASQNWNNVQFDSYEWHVFNCFDALVRWGVPVFVMISGALFLSKDISIRLIYSKYVFHMLTAFFVWSAVYAILTEKSVGDCILAALKGHYHMWFVLMITGLYICIPLMNSIIKTDLTARYFMILALFFAVIIPTAKNLMEDFSDRSAFGYRIAQALFSDIGMFCVSMVMGYTGYFIYGYYLNKTDVSEKNRRIIYGLGLLGLIFTLGLNVAASYISQGTVLNYNTVFSFTILLESTAVFVYFKYRTYDNIKLNALVRTLSGYCFGAYLAHTAFIGLLDSRFGINTLFHNPLIMVPSIVLFDIIASFTVSAFMNHIPVIKKYLV